VLPENSSPLRISLFSLPANVFSYLNLNVPIYIEWIDLNDSTNTVKFREKIFLRINKETELQIKHVKKQIQPKSTDLLSTTLLQLVDDLFADGFVDECLERLEKHPETLYVNMDNQHTVTQQNIQSILYSKDEMELEIYDITKMKEQADNGKFLRVDSLHKFN